MRDEIQKNKLKEKVMNKTLMALAFKIGCCEVAKAMNTIEFANRTPQDVYNDCLDVIQGMTELKEDEIIKLIGVK